MKKALVALVVISSFTWGAQAAGDPLRKVAKDFGKKMKTLNQPRVGLLAFPYHDGKISSGSSIVSERLMTYMAEIKGVRLVERNLLKKLLEEQHLSETGVVDASAAQKIGKVLGVDVIVTGTLNDLVNDTTELNARILKADSGEVLAASRAVMNRTWADSPRFPRAMVKRMPVQEEPEEKPVDNEAIRIGLPGGRGAGKR